MNVFRVSSKLESIPQCYLPAITSPGNAGEILSVE
jgi:hypothetical protein